MLSQPVETLSAEVRFRQAFERLKAGEPKVLEQGTPVTQNNVAREAGCDTTALKKARYPALIREIQAFVELHKSDDCSNEQGVRKQRAKRSKDEQLDDFRRQRDQAQSILASANVRIVELVEQVQSLQREIDELRPPLTRLGR